VNSITENPTIANSEISKLANFEIARFFGIIKQSKTTDLQLKIKIYIYILGFVAAASMAGFIYVLNQVDPEVKDLNLTFLLAAILPLAFSLSVLIGFWLRRRLGQRELLQAHFNSSLRQGLWLAVLVTASATLQAYRLFTWINSLLLVLALLFLEFYFITRERKYQ
jgi:hypothetical protein